ncbi:DJ-1 [Fomitiporia mediterranea MF3/22]|uniref:DJ-1 n=1 Tax=Fomitiporia mediterranea (strain MF3/22) TaxID=694068 RepID=UPI0004409ACC|nr:DJ-1 [Fomitiporia mediterranea MF3/22]EJD05557.1 DJ-1 [Fomitiporia mediterranea MF3/22]
MPSALIFIADGTEEMEFTITYDTLVRAGVKCASVFVPSSSANEDQKTATCSRGVKIIADTTLRNVLSGTSAEEADLLVVPGGAKGAETISGNADVQKLVKRQLLERGKHVGMICAGSLAAKTSSLPRQPLTSHPSVKNELDKGFEYSDDPVVVSGKLVTSRGPGTAFPFALRLVEEILGAEKRAEVQDPMVFPPGAI